MNEELEIKIQAAEEFYPVYATEGAAGADVKACIEDSIVIGPGEKVLVPTGVKAEIPHGYEIQVRPRSGLAFKHMVTVLNAPGTIDSDYRGEIKVLLINHSQIPFEVTPKMRIAQLVYAKALQASFVPGDQLVSSVRGEGGFGHTGSH